MSNLQLSQSSEPISTDEENAWHVAHLDDLVKGSEVVMATGVTAFPATVSVHTVSNGYMTESTRKYWQKII